MSDIIFIGMENWEPIWRRFQPLCAHFAERFPQSKVLFVELPRDLSHSLKSGKFADLSGPASFRVSSLPNVTVTRAWKVFPNTLAWGRKLNEALMRMHIRRAMRNLGMKNPILYINPHSAVHMAGKMGESSLVYDIGDDWATMDVPQHLKNLIIRQDAELCQMADAVIVVSQNLHDAKKTLSQNLHLIPNGVDLKRFSQPSKQEPSNDLPPEAVRWQKPVFGFAGTLHSERIDVPLIVHLASEMPNTSVVLIGPNLLTPQDQSQLAELKNVFLPGEIPHQVLPRYIRAFNVCITPTRLTPFTESNNPLKLWEYLAIGKPIVSTKIAGFRDYPNLVHLAETPGEFVAACRAALEEPSSVGLARQSEAQKHSWEARVSDIVAVLEGLKK